MATPLSLGDFGLDSSRGELLAVGARLLLEDAGAGAAEGEWTGQRGDDLGALDRRRTSSIDSKVRGRRSMSPRPAPYLRGGSAEYRERAATTGHKASNRIGVGGVLATDVAPRSRSWTTGGNPELSDLGIERSRSIQFGDSSDVPRLPPLLTGPSRDDSASSSEGGGDGGGDRLVPGRIELYASPTADADMDALFDVLEPGSLASQQIPLRSRALPYVAP